MSRWFRVYDDMVDDPKVQRLSDVSFKALVNLWCLASQGGGKLPSIADIAFKLRMKPEKVAALISSLHNAGLIDQDGDDIHPHNWGARQFKTDEPKASKGKDSYVYVIGHSWGADALKIGFSKNPWARIGELQTAHHEKLSVLAVFKCESHSEVDVHDVLKPFRKSGEWFSLPAKVYVAISNAADRSCHYDDLVVELRELLRSATTETEADTEADTEAEQRQKEPRAVALVGDWPSDGFDRFWAEYPTKIAKKAAIRAFATAKRSGVKFETVMFGLSRYKAEKPPHVEWCHPATWLNGGRWEDQPAASTPNGQRSSVPPRRSGADDFFAGIAEVAADIGRDSPVARTADADIPRGRFEFDAEPTR